MRQNDVEAATARFEKKIKEGFFARDRSQNTEVDYKLEKQDRDTQAVKDFVRTDMFKELLNGCNRG